MAQAIDMRKQTQETIDRENGASATWLTKTWAIGRVLPKGRIHLIFK